MAFISDPLKHSENNMQQLI